MARMLRLNPYEILIRPTQPSPPTFLDSFIIFNLYLLVNIL